MFESLPLEFRIAAQLLFLSKLQKCNMGRFSHLVAQYVSSQIRNIADFISILRQTFHVRSFFRTLRSRRRSVQSVKR